MRRILVPAVVCAMFLSVAACSDKPSTADASKATPGASSTPDPSGSTGPDGAPASPGAPGGGVTGPTTDKASCEAITGKLSAWGASFADAASGLAAAGSDVKKVEVVVNKVKAANTQFANELRTVGGASKDPQVKTVSENLATSLEKINTQLNAQQVAQNPDALTSIFDIPEYATAAETYEKVCAA